MGIMSEIAAQAGANREQGAPPEEDGIGDSLRKGFSSGMLGARSQLNSIAGLGGEAMGYPDFAAARAKDANDLREQAAAAAPQVNQWRDVHSLRGGANFLAGQLGAMAPVAGAAIGAGLLTGNPILGGTLAMAPFAAGDIAQRQAEDPVSAAQPAGTRFAQALGGGVVAGAAQNAGPAMFASKLVGPAAASLARRSAGEIIGTNLVHGVGVNAAASAGGEAIEQYATNQDKPLDTSAIRDAAITGAVVGAPFGAAGAAADLTRRIAPTVAKTINEKLAERKAAAQEQVAPDANVAQPDAPDANVAQPDVPDANVAQPDAPDANVAQPGAPKTFGSMWDDVKDLASKGKEKLDDSVDRVANGQPLGDLKEFATATGDRLTSMVDLSENETAQKVAGWAKQMSEDAGLTPERRQALSDALASGNSAAVAGVKKAYDLGKAAVGKINTLYDSYQRRDIEGEVRDVSNALPAPKKSEDYSGALKAVVDDITPILQRSQPDLLNNGDALMKLGTALRETITEMQRGPLSSDRVAKLIDVLGPDTSTILVKLGERFGASSGVDPVKTEAFFKQITDIGKTQDLYEQVRQAMTPEAQASSVSSQIPEFVNQLVGLARGDENHTPSQTKLLNDQINDVMKQYFGEHADVIGKAIEKEAFLNEKTNEKLPSAGGFDENGDRIDNQPLDVITKGRGKNNDPVMHPDLFRANNELGQNYAAQYMSDLTAAHPDRQVRFEYADGSKTHGHAVAEKVANPDELSNADVDKMRLDTKKYPNSKDRLDVGGNIYDSRRIAPAMQGKFEYSTFDEQSKAHRLSRMFHEGMSRLTELHGQRIKVRDETVIGKIAGQDFTFGDSKKLASDTAKGDTSVEGLNYTKDETRIVPDKNDQISLAAKELAKNDTPIFGDRKKDSELQKTGVELMADKRNARPSDDLLHKSDMSGDRHSAPSDRPTPRNDLISAVQAWGRQPSESAKKIAARAKVLLDNFDAMGKKDQARFKELVDQSAAGAATTVNSLATKYKGAVSEAVKGTAAKAVEPKRVTEGDESLAGKEGPPSPKVVAAKKAAFLERAASGDKALIKELQTSTDAKGLQRAVEALTEPGKNGVKTGYEPGKNGVKTGYEPGKNGVIDTINARLSELVQNPDVAYGLLTKKYSLVGEGIHNDLNKPGFSATHDSPIKHEGKFDWRAHQGNGEGNASFGAGTYLSTSQGVHRSYKRAFTAQTTEEPKVTNMPFLEKFDGEMRATMGQMMDVAVTLGTHDPAKLRQDIIDSVDHIRDGIREGVFKEDPAAGELALKNAQIATDAARKATVEDFDFDMGDVKSPTYEVSVNIEPHQIMDWDKPLSGQSEFVQKAILNSSLHDPKAFNDAGAGPTEQQARATAMKVLGNRKGVELYTNLAEMLGSQAKASDYLQSLGILGHKYAASGGKNDTHPNYVVYDDSKIETNYVHFSAQATDPNAQGPINRAAVEAHLDKVLGPSVKRAWANFTHAGEYDSATNTIRLSVHALDPMSAAYHESMHALFKQLRDTGATDITEVLTKAAQSEHVINQMNEFFKNEPGVMRQLADSEERAAYMYQMWATGNLTIGAHVKTVFEKIAGYIRKVLGMWSNDDRALHILDYFNTGEYAKNLGSPNAVRRALMEPGRNHAVETAATFTAPLARFADALISTGSGRLRGTGIPALIRVADLVKREYTTEGGDQGFIPAARIEATKRRTALSEALAPFTPAQLHEAMEALQNGSSAASPEARLAQRAIKGVLRETRDYMVDAGVKVGDLGPDYFFRVWDSHYISKHQQAFHDMLEPYIRSGQFKGTADGFIRSLASREGNEFGIETRGPGMQFTKNRTLNFITSADSAPFVNKDLVGSLSSYINQATRKAEWERRMGGGKLESLFTQAKKEGATDAHLELAENYLKGIDGTLGETGGPFEMTPTVRRLFGNMIVYQNVRLLPLSMFSSLLDPLGVLVRGGTVRDAWKTFTRGMSEIPESFGRKATADEATRLAEMVGVVDSAVLSNVMGDVYTQGMVGGTAKKINHVFFKLNMMEGLNRSFRIGASQAAMGFMDRHADGTASAHSKRWMNELGLQAGDVQSKAGGGIKLSVADGLTAEQVTRVHAAVNQWVDGAVLRPDAADKTIWMNDPHYALIAHLKQFVYSFQKTILGRTLHEIKHGNYQPAMALASYVPMMIAADFAKGLLQGGGSQPDWKKGWDIADYIGYGIQRAGLLGVGQFGYDIFKNVQRGGTGVGALAGPTLEQFADVVNTLGGRKQFGPTVLDAMPANALYAHSLGGDSGPGPNFTD